MAATGIPALDQVIANASAKYGVPADVLTGIWRIESGSSYPNQFVNKEGYGGLFGTTMWNAPPQDQANYAASILSNLIHQYGSVSAALYHYSGGGYSSVPGSGGETTQPAAGFTPSAAGFTPSAPGAPTDAIAQILLANGGLFPQAKTVKASFKNPVVKVAGKPSADLTAALHAARQYLDQAKGAFSNAGFAAYIHGQRGTQLPSHGRGQFRVSKPTSSPRAGDLVFGPGGRHLGVMVDHQTYLGADRGGRVLKVAGLADQPAAGLVAVRTVDGAAPIS